MNDQLDRRVSDAIRAIVDDVPLHVPAPGTVRERAAYRSGPAPRRWPGWTPALAAAAVVAVLAGTVVLPLGGPADDPPRTGARPTHPVLPRHLHDSRPGTASVSDSPPGPAIALHRDQILGLDPLFDAAVLVESADGRRIRRLDLAEDRGRMGEDGEWEAAATLLSPDGTLVAVTDATRVTDRVEVVDLRTGRSTAHRLDPPAAAAPLAWTADSGRLAVRLGTVNDAGVLVDGQVAVVDLAGGSARRLDHPGRGATDIASFSPDGRYLVTGDVTRPQQAPTLYVHDLTGAGPVRTLTGPVDHALAGPYAWSPDGSLIALTGTVDHGYRSVSFVDASGTGRPVPASVRTRFREEDSGIELLGWRAPGVMLVGLDGDGYGRQVLQLPVDGGGYQLLSQDGWFLQLAQNLLVAAEVRDTDPSHGPWPWSGWSWSVWLCVVVVGGVGAFAGALWWRARRRVGRAGVPDRSAGVGG
jgi:hypothetical protein